MLEIGAGYLAFGMAMVFATGRPRTRGEWLGVPLVVFGWPVIVLWACFGQDGG